MIQDHCHTRLPAHLVPALRRLAQVTCPKEMEYPGLTDAVLDHLELTLDSLPRHIRLALLAGVQTMEEGARLWPKGRFRPFSALPLDRAIEYWERWWWASGAEIPSNFAKAIKAFMVMGYYEHPTIKAQLEFLPEVWTVKVASERLKRWSKAIQAHDALVLADDPTQAAEAACDSPSDPKDTSKEPDHATASL